jgi:hypothetical protein
MHVTEYEIVCADVNGGVSRSIRGSFSSVGEALAKAAAKAPEHCTRVLLLAVEGDSVVWDGSRAQVMEAAASRKTTPPANDQSPWGAAAS